MVQEWCVGVILAGAVLYLIRAARQSVQSFCGSRCQSCSRSASDSESHPQRIPLSQV
jgi:hypothetical protein